MLDTVHTSLESYVRAVDAVIVRAVEGAGLEPEQRALVLAGLAHKGVGMQASATPIAAPARPRKPLSSHSLAPLYLTIRAHGAHLGADAEPLGAGLMLFYYAIDLVDSVQDDELVGPLGEAGPQVAINCAITLLVLAQDALHGFARGLPPALAERAAAAIREHALRSSRGQHRDLVSRGHEVTAAAARTTSIEKSALCALRMELAGLYVGAVDPRYRQIGDAMAELRQLVNDVADLFDGDRSEDLRQGTMSMPLAMFVEQAGEEGREALAQARRQPQGEAEIQRRVFASGVLRQVAVQTEAVRRRMHEAFAGLPCHGPHLALLLAALDELPSIYYRPPPLTVAIDVDAVDAVALATMSAPDRALLEALHAQRRARTSLTPNPRSKAS